MRRYSLPSVYLPQGWVRDAVVEVSAQGFISDVDTSTRAAHPAPGLERIDGIIVPGMSNGHSHAFQRAMAGKTEYRLSARDSFWTWRQAMYALANRIDPGDLQTLATQLFVEMLKSGYTSVAEFHYLHRQRGGILYSGANALWDATCNAASIAGLMLTTEAMIAEKPKKDSAPSMPDMGGGMGGMGGMM